MTGLCQAVTDPGAQPSRSDGDGVQSKKTTPQPPGETQLPQHADHDTAHLLTLLLGLRPRLNPLRSRPHREKTVPADTPLLLGKSFVGAGVKGRNPVLKRLIEAGKFLPGPELDVLLGGTARKPTLTARFLLRGIGGAVLIGNGIESD